MITVKDIVEQLSAIENQNQPIICAYWLAETFEFADGTPSPMPEVFGKVAKVLENYDLFSEVSEVINDEVYEHMREFMCEDCEEPLSALEKAGNDGLCDSCHQLREEN
jgi:hypothetical protein